MPVMGGACALALGCERLLLGPGAAVEAAVLVGAAFLLRTFLALARGAEVDDLGHGGGDYFLRKASSETTEPGFFSSSPAFGSD